METVGTALLVPGPAQTFVEVSYVYILISFFVSTQAQIASGAKNERTTYQLGLTLVAFDFASRLDGSNLHILIARSLSTGNI